MKKLYYFFLVLALIPGLHSLQGQDLVDITDVTLTFTPTVGDAVSVSATNDGQGTFVPSGSIDLTESTNYTLTIQVQNSGGDNLHDTISARGEDFLFLFGFEDTTMASPSGAGNINDRSQTINYDDQDGNSLPIGLTTSWETICQDVGNAPGIFRVVLQNQDTEKSDTSTIGTGTTQFDITWDLNVQEDQDAPPCENEEEVINLVVLNFVARGTMDTLTFEWFDADGDAPGMPVIEQIELDESTEYDLFVEFFNTIEGEDITDEIREEDDEHQLFFGFTDTLFASPSGNGNDMEPFGPINYEDSDDNGRPLGLATSWEAICRGGAGDAEGEFRVILKHQPGEKDDDSDVNTGETDIAVTFPTTIVADPQAPPCENEEEVINLVVLNFVARGTMDTLTFEWFDADGDAPGMPVIDPVLLDESTEYDLFVEFFNTIEGEDITDEIREEDDEHQLFFGFTDTLFASPSGNGNDMAPFGPINYLDFDDNDRPLGLETSWEAICRGGDGDAEGEFRVILKHQPGEKDDDSDVNTGETDIAVTFPTTIIADPQAPPCENEEEVINLVVLNFVAKGTTDTLTFEWFDEDGDAPLPPTSDQIELDESTEYDLFVELFNTIEGEDITDEIREEDDEHQFFFGFTDSLFASPSGSGNAEGPGRVNYQDFDDNGRPVGLRTAWAAICRGGTGDASGEFRVILKHQPGEKDDDSDVNTGETDIDITFDALIIADPQAPPCENEEEEINLVTLNFVEKGTTDTLKFEWFDEDSEAPLPPTVDRIELNTNTEYELFIELRNTIEGEDITDEIREEDDEHQFFFGWTGGLFSDPTGNGNTEEPFGQVNYLDFDDNQRPVGLETEWTTAAEAFSGSFRVVLKHQPGEKDDDSDVTVGGTDIDISFPYNNVVTSTGEAPLVGSLLVFPNPTKGQLNVDLSFESPKDLELMIFDSFGRLVMKERAQGAIGILNLDVQRLPQGNYFLQMRSNTQSWTQRFLKVD